MRCERLDESGSKSTTNLNCTLGAGLQRCDPELNRAVTFIVYHGDMAWVSGGAASQICFNCRKQMWGRPSDLKPTWVFQHLSKQPLIFIYLLRLDSGDVRSMCADNTHIIYESTLLTIIKTRFDHSKSSKTQIDQPTSDVIKKQPVVIHEQKPKPSLASKVRVCFQ